MLCVFQCTEGSLNHPGVTIQLLCSSALPFPAESPATEQEVETGEAKRCHIKCVNRALQWLYRQLKCQGSKRHPLLWLYWESAVCFGPLQGQVLATALSNNLQFYWQQIGKFPIITPPLCHTDLCLHWHIGCAKYHHPFPAFFFTPC